MSRITYKSHPEQPIYCFKVDEATGHITKWSVENYTKVCVSQYMERYVYHFDGRDIGVYEKYYTLKDMKIDRFVSNKLFTFNPELKAAIDVIESTLLSEEKEALEKYEAVRERLLIFREENRDEKNITND